MFYAEKLTIYTKALNARYAVNSTSDFYSIKMAKA